MTSVTEIEAELDKLNSVKRTMAQNLGLLVLSLLVFASTGLLNASWMSVVILVIVLLIHESGHWIGMKLFGYRDVRMLFIPFVGAAVSGRELGISGERRAIVYLLGPVPGILLGLISGYLYLRWRQPVLLTYYITSLLINGFNLLPIFPLDGGQFFETVLFSRHPAVELIFRVLAALALAGLAFKLSSPVLGGLALATLVATRESYLQSKILSRLRETRQPTLQQPPIRIPHECLESILPDLSTGLRQKNIQAKILARRADSIWQRFCRRSPRLRSSVALLTVYAGIWMLGTMAVVWMRNDCTILPKQVSDERMKVHALAFGALINASNRDPLYHLAKPDADEQSKEANRRYLADWWDVHSKPELLAMLQRLRVGLHRQRFREMKALLQPVPIEYAFEAAAKGVNVSVRNGGRLVNVIVPKPKDNDEVIHRLVVLYYMQTPEVEVKGRKTPLISAWDFGRYVTVCTFGYRSGYLTETETWDLMLPMARRIQLSYNSWQEYADDYLRGRAFWSLGQMRENGAVLRRLALILQTPKYPWGQIRWEEPLNDGFVAFDPLNPD